MRRPIHQFLTYFIAAIWLTNGLYCKVLNFVPRHQEIVANILGVQHPRVLTILIGLAEIMMAIWIVTGILPKINAIIQIALIVTMNILEFIFVPELLLWGKLNLAFAFLLVLIIYYQHFYYNEKSRMA